MTSADIQTAEQERMSLNIYDQVWIKRLFDLQDQSLEKYIDDSLTKSNELVYAKVAQVLAEQNTRMVTEMHKHTTVMEGIQKSIAELVKRMDHFEKRLLDDEGILVKVAAYTGTRSTMIRITMTVLIAVFISLLIILFTHTKL